MSRVSENGIERKDCRRRWTGLFNELLRICQEAPSAGRSFRQAARRVANPASDAVELFSSTVEAMPLRFVWFRQTSASTACGITLGIVVVDVCRALDAPMRAACGNEYKRVLRLLLPSSFARFGNLLFSVGCLPLFIIMSLACDAGAAAAAPSRG
jgi:hypothetical protein